MAVEEGKELVKEVWGVVADHYLDARSGGFDLERWTQLRDHYLERMSPDPEAAFRCNMLSSTSPCWCPPTEMHSS